MDKIYLNQLEFYAYHGALKEETALGQRFTVDLELNVDLKKAGQTDQLSYTVHYGEVYEIVKSVVEGQTYQLIESVGERIAKEVLSTYEMVKGCKVKVIKPTPPIAGVYQSVAIEIDREPSDYE
ncbi:dihydroneopterin aldolase [Pelagirhabdus alkalitolerans]|uniref:7,8-dihydroneopterin aldolase n=1 Tax=Pelagirhabdus alkalitolerans TaxID=1612202 RepID=A0A1G6MFQ6_9BACI|nr:dihydroneopterin aldolase [Pelagirhabdus alkalitolerans]SDC54468.1 dihydroneopterin aldolase [Pelagirhabdus alkalitolerans]